MSDKGQIERFQDAARELGCNEDEAAFDQKLAKIARQKPAQKPEAETQPVESKTDS